jgi:hypothetical protein
MNLHRSRAASISAAMVTVGALICAQPAHAFDHVIVPASACEVVGPQWDGGQTPPLTRFAGYLSGNRSFTTQVTCPLPRYSDGGDVRVYVDARVSANSWMECWINSRNYDGTDLGGANFVEFGSGVTHTIDKLLTVSEAQAPHWAYLNLTCTLGSPLERVYGFSVSR